VLVATSPQSSLGRGASFRIFAGGTVHPNAGDTNARLVFAAAD